MRRVITKVDGLPEGLQAGTYIVKCSVRAVKEGENETVFRYLAESVEPYNPVSSEAGKWLAHKGWPIPVIGDIKVDVKLRDGKEMMCVSSLELDNRMWTWLGWPEATCDIVNWRYHVAKPLASTLTVDQIEQCRWVLKAVAEDASKGGSSPGDVSLKWPEWGVRVDTLCDLALQAVSGRVHGTLEMNTDTGHVAAEDK